MPGLLAHMGGLTNCLHAAAITASPSNLRVKVNGGQAVLTTLDLLTIAGCPFQIPTPAGITKPQPCVTVRLEPSARVKINGAPALLVTPAALCYSAEQIPQGPPNSSPNQKRVIAT
jgi:hypothetical protein